MKRSDDRYLFKRVVEPGGFSAPAERATGIPKSRLSQRIAELEVELSTQRLRRSSHRARHPSRAGVPPPVKALVAILRGQ